MTIGNNIDRIRKERHLSSADLAALIGVDPSTISNWQSGRRIPTIDYAVRIADSLNITLDELVTPDAVLNNGSLSSLKTAESKLLRDYRTLDDYGRRLVSSVCSMEKERVAAQGSAKTSDVLRLDNAQPTRLPLFQMPAAAGWAAPIDECEFEMIDITSKTPKDADFAVKIQGNSMFPYVRDKEIVYVHRTEELSMNEIGIIAVNGATYCKFLFRDAKGNVTLVSANPDYKSSNVYVSSSGSDSIRVFGKVILTEKTRFPSYFLEEL